MLPGNFQPKSTKRLGMRVTAVTAIYSLLIALLVSALQIYINYQQTINDAKQQFHELESGYAQNLTASLWVVDTKQVNILLGDIANLPHVGSVELVDESNRPIKRSNFTNFDSIAHFEYPLIYKEGNFSYELGTLKVELTDSSIIKEIMSKSISIAITTFATILLTSAFILIVLNHWVSRHLETMAIFATKLDVDNLDTPLQLERKENSTADELDLVVNSINKMQITLRDGIEKRRLIELELIKHREHLEDLVSERTAELLKKTRQLETQSHELEAQNRELDAYAHSVAHDLKNPLTSIIGAAGILQSDKLLVSPEQAKKSAQLIDRTAQKMNSIIDALLLLASVRRIDDIKIGTINSLELAKEASYRLRELASDYGAQIEFVGEWQQAIGYEEWVEEVWINYLSNAIKYGGTPPKIEIGCTPSAGKMIRYWVRDHGKGIPATRRSELFIQFSRLDPRVTDGHGLGLSIAKRIIHRLGGEVGYEEPISHGSIFWFTLPAADESL